MQNYFNYFTEIEQHFAQRRGSMLLLSTLDWALIETWREAGLALPVVLRGIDHAFDRHDARAQRAHAGRLRKVNGLAWCAQAVMEAAEAAAEAAIGGTATTASSPAGESGFETEPVTRYLRENAEQLSRSSLPEPAAGIASAAVARLRELAGELERDPGKPLEELDRALSAMEERLMAALVTATPETEILRLREAAGRELAPYRSRMGAVQLRQLQAQFLHKRLLEEHGLPRLSLFYMSHR